MTADGIDSGNHKPNYYSVMNYQWQFEADRYRRWQIDPADPLLPAYINSWKLDYSHKALPLLNEATTGTFNIGMDASKVVAVSQLWESSTLGWVYPTVQRQQWRLVPMGGAVPRVNVNLPAHKLTGRTDLNFVDDMTRLGAKNGPVPALQNLQGAEDWSRLIYNFRESPSFGHSHGSHATELSSDMYQENPPPPRFARIVAFGADAGNEPRVQVVDPSGVVVQDFLAFDAGFKGGVRVAVGDVNGDGTMDVIAAMGPGGDTVKVFSGGDPAQVLFTLQPYGAGFAGTTATHQPFVRVYNGANTAQVLNAFAADDLTFLGGMRVAVVELENGGHSILTGQGPGRRVVQQWGALAPVLLDEIEPFADGFSGAFVG